MSVSPYVASAARRATKFEIGSIWRPRAGHHAGWHDYRVIAITDHETCPIVGQNSLGMVMSWGLDGRADGEREIDTDMDLVTRVS